MYKRSNKPQSEQTAKPEMFPQGRFFDKPCRNCGTVFSPKAPSHLYCCDECVEYANTDGYLMRTYNINYSQYKELIQKHDSKCAICKQEGFILSPNSKMKIVIDHDHLTAVVRGMLCHNCNRALGLFQDSIKNLETAIDYLKGATTISEESTPKRVEAQDSQKADDIV